MPTVHPRHSIPAALAAAILLASCAGDAPTSANESPLSPDEASVTRISVCHRSGSTGTIVQISPADLAQRLGQGDYLTSLLVSHASGQPVDAMHFRRIGDALAAARAGRLARGELTSGACRITITVAPGTFGGTSTAAADKDLERFPLVVDVPGITLRGALVMGLDAYGRATGVSVTQRATTLALETQPDVDDVGVPIILANGHPGGSAGHGLTIEGFALHSGNSGGFAVFGIRVRGLTIRGNRFEEGFGVPVDLREANAVITRNQVGGTGLCDMCLAGPGVFQLTGNRLLAGALEGILITPAIDFFVPEGVEPSTLSATSQVTADITNNEIRDHRLLPAGAAIRIGAIGLGAPDVHGSSHITIRDNLLVNNNFAMMIEGSFPVLDTKLRGDIDVTLGGNILQRSCQADLYVAFTRHTTGLGLQDDPYLRNSTFRVTLGGNLRFSDAWFSNPRGYGNTLLVDGRQIGNGTRQFFSFDTCPARTAVP